MKIDWSPQAEGNIRSAYKRGLWTGVLYGSIIGVFLFVFTLFFIGG